METLSALQIFETLHSFVELKLRFFLIKSTCVSVYQFITVYVDYIIIFVV